MRHLCRFLCVCALGLMPLVGCETTGNGGTGGTAGTGGGGGSAGDGGSGGTLASCEGNVCPCNEAGIRAAIEAGGNDPYTFDCDGPTTVVTEAEIVIDNDVILDGEGNLTVDGEEDHNVFSVPSLMRVELRNFIITGGGRGIISDGDLILAGSTVSGNEIGIVNTVEEGVSDLTVMNCTISGNRVGGILSFATTTVTNSTVSGNLGQSTQDPVHNGGIVNLGGTLTISSSTVSGNVGDDLHIGGEGFQESFLTIKGSVVDGSCEFEPEYVISSNGYNLESPGNTCGFEGTGDQVNVTEMQLNLGELADNGGPTMTHVPGDGGFDDGSSAAIDHIPGDACALTEDQRGQPRPETGGTRCDVGSVEVQPIPAEGCLQSGGTVSTALCCQSTESFPNTCTTGACGCAPDASHEVDVCICPANTCFDGESCVAQ